MWLPAGRKTRVGTLAEDKPAGAEEEGNEEEEEEPERKRRKKTDVSVEIKAWLIEYHQLQPSGATVQDTFRRAQHLLP